MMADENPFAKYAQPEANPFAKYATQAQPEPVPQPPQGGFAQGAGNLLAGAVRGAGSIGATIVDQLRSKLADPVSQAIPDNMRPRVTNGLQDMPRGAALRSGMDGGLRELGAQPDTMMYKGGQLAGEIAGTAGAGGAIAKGMQAVPMLAKLAPVVQSGGLTLGSAGTGSRLANAGIRAAGGATAGGAAAAMVNPEDAVTGAVIGGGLPLGVVGAGKAATAVTNLMRGKPAPASVQQAAGAAIKEGYVVPPTQVRPTLLGSLAEGLGGKLKTRQQASALNQGVTNRLAKTSLGMNEADDLTLDALQAIRNQAGEAYTTIRKAGEVAADDSYLHALDTINATRQGASRSFPGLQNTGVTDLVATMRQPKFDASDAVDALKVLRENADTAYRAGDHTAGKATKEAAKALEDLLERSLTGSGQAEAVAELRKARELIAKTYTVQKALNQSTGSVNAIDLAKQLSKGKPLTGDLRKAAEFGTAFPHSAKVPEQAGGVPAFSPLDLGMASMGSGPSGLIGMLSRPALRAYALSPRVQRGLLDATPPPNGLLQGPSGDGLLGFGVRAAPLLGIDR